jgi:SAM-dependent methyltransferase
VRPPYYTLLVDRAIELLAVPRGARVLDLGAGTGRLTRELATRFDDVIAVEPDEAMRALVDAGTVVAGSAEEIPLPDASVDAAFVSEAFHWFVAERALAELARVLVPRGGLAVISTHWFETEPPLPEAALARLREHYGRTRDQRRPPWDEAFAASPFEPLRTEDYEEELVVDADRLLELYSTTSNLAVLIEDERRALLDELRPLLTGPYRLPVQHELAWTRLAQTSNR